jgi:hypothetical protein
MLNDNEVQELNTLVGRHLLDALRDTAKPPKASMLATAMQYLLKLEAARLEKLTKEREQQDQRQEQDKLVRDLPVIGSRLGDSDSQYQPVASAVDEDEVPGERDAVKDMIQALPLLLRNQGEQK